MGHLWVHDVVHTRVWLLAQARGIVFVQIAASHVSLEALLIDVQNLHAAELALLTRAASHDEVAIVVGHAVRTAADVEARQFGPHVRVGVVAEHMSEELLTISATSEVEHRVGRGVDAWEGGCG